MKKIKIRQELHLEKEVVDNLSNLQKIFVNEYAAQFFCSYNQEELKKQIRGDWRFPKGHIDFIASKKYSLEELSKLDKRPNKAVMGACSKDIGIYLELLFVTKLCKEIDGIIIGYNSNSSVGEAHKGFDLFCVSKIDGCIYFFESKSHKTNDKETYKDALRINLSAIENDLIYKSNDASIGNVRMNIIAARKDIEQIGSEINKYLVDGADKLLNLSLGKAISLINKYEEGEEQKMRQDTIDVNDVINATDGKKCGVSTIYDINKNLFDVDNNINYVQEYLDERKSQLDIVQLDLLEISLRDLIGIMREFEKNEWWKKNIQE